EDEVRAGRGLLLREPSPKRTTRTVHVATEDPRVRTREVHVLEDAALQLRGGADAGRAHLSVRADRDDLAGIHLALDRRADDVERAGLGGEYVRAIEAAHHQRAPTARV